jgi:hypothetical protein
VEPWRRIPLASHLPRRLPVEVFHPLQLIRPAPSGELKGIAGCRVRCILARPHHAPRSCDSRGPSQTRGVNISLKTNSTCSYDWLFMAAQAYSPKISGIWRQTVCETGPKTLETKTLFLRQ